MARPLLPLPPVLGMTLRTASCAWRIRSARAGPSPRPPPPGGVGGGDPQGPPGRGLPQGLGPPLFSAMDRAGLHLFVGLGLRCLRRVPAPRWGLDATAVPVHITPGTGHA